MFTRRAKLLWLLLLFSDLILLALAFEIAYLARANVPGLRLFYLNPEVAGTLLLTAGVLWTGIGTALQVYRRAASFRPGPLFRLPVSQAFWFGLTLPTAIYLLKLGEVSRSFLALFVFLALLLQAVYRLLAPRMRQFLRQEFTAPRNYLIVGTGPKAVELARCIEQNEDHGDRILGFVWEAEKKQEPAEALSLGKPVWDLASLPAMLEQHIVDEVLVAVSKEQLEKLEDLLLTCEEQGIKTRVLVDFFPHLRSDISLDKLEHLPLLTFSRTPENEYLLFLKQAMDLALGVVVLVVSAPLLAAIALLVRLTSPGPAIYRQLRCGLNGRKFWFYKFRSMYLDADQMQEQVAHLNEMDGPVFKSSRDPRVTPLGRFLRRTSLDEFPQLFNILRGDMSFVGPRPPLPQEVAQYEKWQRRRLRMKPGLTCLWVLEGRNQLNFARWMKLDMEYIDNWSLSLDLKILLLTVPHVLTGRGAS